MSKKECGINDISELYETLAKLLADTYFLYLKTHNYHWNVTGENFFSLHSLFEMQYNEMFQAVDVIAERIRTIGYRAPGSFEEFKDLTAIKEEKLPSNANLMVQKLKEDHSSLIMRLRQTLSDITCSNDEETKNLLVDRLAAHEKAHWMLDSSLKR